MIQFLLNNKILASISYEGLTIGEIEETRNLLAYENNVKPEDITIKY